MKYDIDIINKTRRVLDSCLSDTAFARVADEEVQFGESNRQSDLALRIILPNNNFVNIVIEVKDNGQPRNARIAVDQLRNYKNMFPLAYGIFAAPYISPEAGEICTREGIGYLDLAGNCRIEIERNPVYLYIRKEGVPNPSPEKRDQRSLYSPKAARVLRVLLMTPAHHWKIQELAGIAGISIGQAYKVKKLLADREAIIETNAGFLLRDPEPVLMDWARHQKYSDKRLVQDYYSFEKPAQVEHHLAEVCESKGIQYGLTEFSGAARVAPFVRYQRATAYIASDLEYVIDRLALKRVTSGANVRLLLPNDEGVFLDSRLIDGSKVVSPIQLYLDLCQVSGRGDEAAETVLAQVLRPLWGSADERIDRKVSYA